VIFLFIQTDRLYHENTSLCEEIVWCIDDFKWPDKYVKIIL